MRTIPHSREVQPIATLLHDAADTLIRTAHALPGPADVRGAIASCLLNAPAGQVDGLARAAWAEIERRWAADGWPDLGSVAGWATYLRYTALQIGGDAR